VEHAVAARVRRASDHPDSRAVLVLVAMTTFYIGVFGYLTWRQQTTYYTFGFDTGIHDQGIWLLSRFKNPYVTVVGRHYLGHHTNFISYLFVPAYWLGAGPHLLLLAQTVWLAAGAVPVWLLARDRLGDRWLALPLAAAYLLYPSIEWINYWEFHPDALMVAPLLFAWLFATRERWRWFAVSVVVLLLCKEDAALAVAAMGAVLAGRRTREQGRGVGAWRIGAITAAVGIGWFLVCTKLLIPTFNAGQAAFYEDMFPQLGSGLGDITKNFVLHPSRFWHLASTHDCITYYRRLLIPVALVALGAPVVLLIAAPQLVVNVSSSLSYTHDIKFHYSSIVDAVVLIATVETIGRFARRPALARVLVGLVFAAALATNANFSPSPLSPVYHQGFWGHPSDHVTALDHAVAEVPPDVGVSASYSLVPHFTHRRIVYEFPNPWIVGNWLDRRRVPDPAKVDWLVIDRTSNPDRADLVAELTGPGGAFVIVSEADQVVVARRIHRPSAATGGK
jgi:uncharacterized membrane protein